MSKARTWTTLVHLIFWVCLGVLIMFVSYSFIPRREVVIVSSLVYLAGLMALVYGNLYVLVPRFWLKKKWGLYALGLIALLTLTAALRFYVGLSLVKAFDWGLEGQFSPRFFGSMIIGGFFVIFITIPLRLVGSWFKRIELEQKIKTHKLEAELRFLKAQVNPHFLFNALNNIYSLSFMQSEKAPEMILKLSDMMSYMLYDCKNDEVPLASEIAYLQNYIDLQQLKKEGELNVRFDRVGDVSGIMIKPMLLIPFFENAFKHGNLEDTERGWLKGKLELGSEGIHFSIENTISPHAPTYEKGGVGLENIQARLDLLYQGQHLLEIIPQEMVFSVKLMLPVLDARPSSMSP